MRIRLVLLIWLLGACSLVLTSQILATTTWKTFDGATVGSSSGNLSKWNGGTIGTSSGNFNVWDNLASPSSGGGVTWTLVQHPHNFTCSFTATGGANTHEACTVTATATTAGNLLILESSQFNTGVGGAGTFVSATGDTFTHCPSQANSENYSAGNYEVTDCAYVLSATGSATSFTFTWSIPTTGAVGDIDVELLEVHRSTGTATYETCGSGTATACTTTSATCTTCTGPTPTVTGTDFAAQWIAYENNITSIASPYNVSPSPDIENTNVEGGFAWSLSQTSGSAGVWTCSGGGAAMAAVAFK